MKNTHAAATVSTETVASTPFLELQEITYTDPAGTLRKWSSVSRTRGHNRAVIIVAELPDGQLILVRQYRPPTRRFCFEFPAGLVEPGEPLETAALRELSEETGYTGKVADVLLPGFSSTGLTDEQVIFVYITVDPGCVPHPHPEETEHIEVFTVRKNQLYTFLQQRQALGDGADTKLIHYAYLHHQKQQETAR